MKSSTVGADAHHAKEGRERRREVVSVGRHGASPALRRECGGVCGIGAILVMGDGVDELWRSPAPSRLEMTKAAWNSPTRPSATPRREHRFELRLPLLSVPAPPYHTCLDTPSKPSRTPVARPSLSDALRPLVGLVGHPPPAVCRPPLHASPHTHVLARPYRRFRGPFCPQADRCSPARNLIRPRGAWLPRITQQRPAAKKSSTVTLTAADARAHIGDTAIEAALWRTTETSRAGSLRARKMDRPREQGTRHSQTYSAPVLPWPVAPRQ